MMKCDRCGQIMVAQPSEHCGNTTAYYCCPECGTDYMQEAHNGEVITTRRDESGRPYLVVLESAPSAFEQQLFWGQRRARERVAEIMQYLFSMKQGGEISVSRDPESCEDPCEEEHWNIQVECTGGC